MRTPVLTLLGVFALCLPHAAAAPQAASIPTAPPAVQASPVNVPTPASQLRTVDSELRGSTSPLRAQPVEARTPGSGPAFNVEAATDAYLAQIPASAKAASDEYFEGGYWLTLWNFLYGAAISIVLLALRWSAAMRDLAERITRFKPLQTFLYWVQYLVATTLLVFPLTVYQGYVREHQYGLATQTFGPWLGDQLKAMALGLVLGGVAVVALFGVLRRFQRTWWIWGSLVTMLFLVFTILISPVYIVPLFNKVTPLQDPKVTGPILSLARANGIPAHDVFEVEESLHSTRISANVSGFGRTMRISLNDNLLRRASPEEIQAVMAHEMGHYVLNHIYKMITFFLIVVVVAFAFLRWGVDWALARWGSAWRVRGIGDPAVLPLVVLVVSIFFFVATPLTNTYSRVQEAEADIFGINASAQPDGMAQAAVHLAEYRKMSPGPLEEWIFFDHPSGRNRIHAAMQWKAEHLGVRPTE
jgi:STE24 endopeptidase